MINKRSRSELSFRFCLVVTGFFVCALYRFVFETGFFPHSSDCPGTYYVAQPGLNSNSQRSACLYELSSLM